MITNKYRIIINVSMLRRDIGYCFLLKRVLERFNFNVLLSSSTNIYFNLKFFKPHAVILNSAGLSRYIKKKFRYVKVLFIEPEGFHLNLNKERKDGKWSSVLENDPTLIDNFDLFLVWGRVVQSEIKAVLKKNDKKKIVMVGSPKLDIIKYFNKESVNSKKSIGIIGRFPNINSVTGKMTIRGLSNIGNLERVIIQCKDFVTNHNVIKEILKKTDYNISIRAHPLEQIKQTESYVKEELKDYSERVEVDKCLVFAEWANKQNYIIAPTTSAFVETFKMKVPLIIIDYISGTFSYLKKFKMTRIWQENSFCPRSLDELLKIIKTKKKLNFKNNEVEKQYDEYCDFLNKEPASFRISKFLLNYLEKNAHNKGSNFYLPKFILRFLNIIKNRIYAKKNILFYESNYDEHLHPEPESLKKIFNLINDNI